MRERHGLHWRLSSLGGLLLTGRYVPICALIHACPDCMARRGAVRLLGRAFDDPRHCERIYDTWAVGAAMRD